MKRKQNTNRRGKQLIAIGGFLILLGSFFMPAFSLFTTNTSIEEQLTFIETQEWSTENTIVGDPEQPLGDPQVHNINTSEYFTSIQDAINDTDTLDGNILEVNTSSYSENVIVNKSLVIRGVSLG